MQPNLKVPQAPYAINPTYRIPRNTVMDASLDALIQQKMREAQYAQQQQAVASRTPTVLFDPLLNLRVRDYYRQKYERSLASEVAGRLVGGVEGAALGAGIAASIAGIAITIASFFEPTPAGEAAGISVLSSGLAKLGLTGTIAKAAAIGGAVGGTAGTIAADYSTWYATQDMFRNMWASQGVGRGLMNTMYFAGQSMDLASTATLVKSSLYSLVSGEDVIEIVRKAYGLTKEGRTDMDFSLIRESLGIDLGGLGNFFFDMSGEISSDLGAIAGIAGGVIRGSKAVNQVYVNVMKEVGEKLVKEEAFTKEISKVFIKNIMENNIDDILLQVKQWQKQGLLNTSFELVDTDLRPIIETYVNEVNRAARKSVGVRLGQAFKEIDLVDDWMTHKLWVAGNPVIFAGSIAKHIREEKYIPKALVKMFGDEKALDIMEFFEGNFAKAYNIKNPISRSMMERFIKNQRYSFVENLVDNGGFKSFIHSMADDIENPVLKDLFYKTLKQEGIDDFAKLRHSSNEFIRANFENTLKKTYDRIDEFDKQVKEIDDALDILKKRIESGKDTSDDISKFTELYKEKFNIQNSKDYRQLNFIKDMVENPDQMTHLSKIVSVLYHLQRKQKHLGALNAQDQKTLQDAFSYLVDEVTKGNKYVESFFEDFNTGGKITASLKKFISDNMSSEIQKQFDSFYKGEFAKFQKFCNDNIPEFKASFVDQMWKKLQKELKLKDKSNIIDQIEKELSEAKTIDEKFNIIQKSIWDNDVSVDLDKRTKAYKIQQEVLSKKETLVKQQNRFKQFYTPEPIKYDNAYNYSRYTSQYEQRIHLAKIKEGIMKVLNLELPEAELKEFSQHFDEYIKTLGDDMVKDADLFIKHMNTIMETMFDVRQNTGRLSRVINNLIPKYFQKIKEFQEFTDRAKKVKLDNFKNLILEHLKTIKGSLKRSSGDSQIRKIIKDVIQLVDVKSFSIADVETIMKKMYDIQARQISIAFDDISRKSPKATAALKRFNKRINSKLKELREQFEIVADSTPSKNKKYYDMIREFINGNEPLSNLDTKNFPPYLIDFVKKYSDIQLQLKTMETIEEKYLQMGDIYESLQEYIKSVYNDSPGTKLTSFDMIEEELAYYVKGFENESDFDFNNNSIFAEKVMSNRYYIEQRLINALKLSRSSRPEIYDYFIKAIDSAIKSAYKGTLSEDAKSSFLDLLNQLCLVNRQVKVIDNLGLASVISSNGKLISPLTIKNGKLIIADNVPKAYGNLIKKFIDIKPEDILDFERFKNSISKAIDDILNDEEALEELKKYSEYAYNKLTKDIFDNTKKPDDVVSDLVKKSLFQKIEEQFPDLYNMGKERTSFIRKSSSEKLSKKSITEHSFVVFDTETTGETSHGVYSIHATRWTYKDGKWQVTEEQSFCLDPSYIEANWKIDDAVDRLNGKGRANYIGSTLEKAKELSRQFPAYKTDQEMAEAFKDFLRKGDTLVAHNSAFDFGELINAMSGGKFLKAGVLDEIGAEEFAKANFDFTIMDTAFLQSYTSIFGSTKRLSNDWLGRASGLVDVVETFKDKNGKVTIFFNGEEVTEIPKSTKGRVLRYDFDENDELIKGSYNGGALHEAKNDVELMNAWFENGLNKMTELDVKFNSLDNTDTFLSNAMSSQLSKLYTDDFKENVQLFLDYLKDTEIESEPSFIQHIKEDLEILQDQNLSYDRRIMAMYDLKDIVESYSLESYIGSKGYKTRKEFMTFSEELKDPSPGQGRLRLSIKKSKPVDIDREINYRKQAMEELQTQIDNINKKIENLRLIIDKDDPVARQLEIEQLTNKIKESMIRVQNSNIPLEEQQDLIQEMSSLISKRDELWSIDYQSELNRLIDKRDLDLIKAYNELKTKRFFEEETIYLEDIINDFLLFDEQLIHNITKIRSLHESDVIGNLKVNTFYGSVLQSANFTTDTHIRNLVDFFNGNKGGSLSDNFATMSSVFQDMLKDPDPAFVPLRELQTELLNIEESLNWYNDLIETTDVNIYDTLDNVIRKIQGGMSKDDIIEYVKTRSIENNFNDLEAINMVNRIYKHLESSEGNKILIPTSDIISSLYNKFLDTFSALLKSIEAENLNVNKGVAFRSRELLDLINNAFESMRVPLRGIKTENRMLQHLPFTSREFSKMSEISKQTVDELKAKGLSFNYNGSAIEFENEIHRMYPGEAIAWRSKYVPKFTEAHKDGIDLKRKINRMNSSNYTKMDGYKNIPYLDATETKMYQYYDLGARAFGMDIESVINKVYQFGTYKQFGRGQKYLDLYEYILGLDDSDLEKLHINKLLLKRFAATMTSMDEYTFNYVKDYKLLRDNIIITMMYNLTHGHYKLFDIDDVVGDWKSTLSDIANKRLNKIKFNAFHNEYMQDSIKLFDDVKSIYTNIDGTYNVDGFMRYLDNHPEYTLVYMDTDGKLIRLQTDPQLVNEVLSSDDIFVSLMSMDAFNNITSTTQQIEIHPLARWLKQNILSPMKRLSLFNLNFVFQNTVTAVFQNTISSEGKINAPKAIRYMVQMAKDYIAYKDLMLSITTSYSARQFLSGSLYAMDKRWIELLTNDEFIHMLEKNGELDVLNKVKKFNPERLERFKFINEVRNTSAARGEVNSITLNNKKEKALLKEANDAKEKLKDKYPNEYQDMIDNLKKYRNHPDYETIAPLVAQVNYRQYQTMSIDKLQEILDDLNSRRGSLNYHEKRQKIVIENILQDKQSNFWSKIFDSRILSSWFNFNEDLETIFRMSAMDMYIKEGSTFDEATAEVIKRHFIYNNKSAAEQYAEFVIPFISYPLRMFSLVEEMTHDSTTMDVLFWFDKYSWGEEESEQSDYLTKRRARGDIPIGDKLFSLGSPFKEGILNFQNPGYALNNKLNPLAKPLVDLATGSQYNRWNQLPVVSNVSNTMNMIKERSLVANFTNDYYRYENYTNYYRPRVNNKIYGSLYNRMYTKSGYSRVLMNMQPLSSSNLKYRVNSIMKYSGPTGTRR